MGGWGWFPPPPPPTHTHTHIHTHARTHTHISRPNGHDTHLEAVQPRTLGRDGVRHVPRHVEVHWVPTLAGTTDAGPHAHGGAGTHRQTDTHRHTHAHTHRHTHTSAQPGAGFRVSNRIALSLWGAFPATPRKQS